MSVILFGSISTLADTSELQRQAFNAAFRAHGLDWRWDSTARSSPTRGSSRCSSRCATA